MLLGVEWSELWSLESDLQEVMGKEEEEKGGVRGKRLPFIPFSQRAQRRTCPMTSWQTQLPGPNLCRPHLLSPMTPPQQANAMLSCSSLSARLVLGR
jgi:hypothetical protein